MGAAGDENRTLVPLNWNRSRGAVDCSFSPTGGSSRTLNKPDNSSDAKQYPGTALAGEPRYRNLVDNARIGIGDVSVDGTIIYANSTALRMFEYDSLDELRKFKVTELWHRPEQRDRFISKLSQDGYVNNYEIEYKTKTGRVVTVLASAILDGDMISQVVIDISERKRAEQALLMSSEIIANVTDAVNVVRAEDGIQVFSNPAFDRMFGYEEDESIGIHTSVLHASTGKDAKESARIISDLIPKSTVLTILNMERYGSAHALTSPKERKSKNNFASRRKWKPWAFWPAASPTILITCCTQSLLMPIYY